MSKKQKNKNRFIFFINLLLFGTIILGGVGYANNLNLFEATGTDDYNDNFGDTYTSSLLNSETRMDFFERNSPEHDSGKRFTIVQKNSPPNEGSYENLTSIGFIVSEQYGDLYISGAILATKSPSSMCIGERISYDLTGKLYNYFWGDFSIITPSYYCPSSKKIKLTLNGVSTEKLTLNQSIRNTETITSTGARGEQYNIATSELFSNNKVGITGVVSLDTANGAINEVGELVGDSSINNNFVVVKSKFKGKMAKFNQIVDRNIVKLTRGLTAVKNNFNPLTDFFEKLYYYDFSTQVGTEINHNEGKILNLGNGSDIKIEGEKILIVKGGNIYIKNNIYNKDKNSLLTIVVKRDKTNRKNGGNIYIDPSVTNIDAILISDGSILSYNGNSILNGMETGDILALRKQLLIYGSISTKNTIGDDKAIYGTDDYINNSGNSIASTLYNLENLRTFQIMPSENVESGVCSGEIGKIVAKNTNTGSLEKAFAGKKNCYYTDSGSPNLRTTEKISSVVIERNPMINIINSKILRP